MISAMLPLSAPYRRYPSVAAAFLFLVVTVASGGHASAAANETEARALWAFLYGTYISANVSILKKSL
jgi:hypothetical protein